MKIRSDFITNSSSSAFVVLRNSNYYKAIQQLEDFNLKYGDDVDRSTGVYQDKALLEFIDFFVNNEWAHNTQILNIKEFINQYGLEKIALVMISDEEMGGYLPAPNYDEILSEMEYH